MTTTFHLTPAEYDATRDKIEKINKRAAKRGFTGAIEVTGEYVTETEHDDTTGESWDRVYVNTTITGQAPCYGGWTFLAAVDTLPAAKKGETTFVLRYAPGAQVSDADRAGLAAGRCQHCNTKINRRYTYLVRHAETGEVKQIGSTCIKDFLGWTGNPVFIDTRKILDEIGDLRCNAEPAPFTPVEVLAVAHAAVRKFGWVSVTAAIGDMALPTSQVVLAYLYGRSRRDAELRDHLRPLVREARDGQAQVIVDTLLAELPGEPGYEANLIAALSAAYVDGKQIGLITSAVSAYDRLMGRKAREVARPDRSQVAHQGEIGERIEVTGTITRCMTVDSCFGTSVLVVVENDTTVAKMFTKAQWAYDVESGNVITLAGRVKAHEHYRGTPQTVLTHCKRTA